MLRPSNKSRLYVMISYVYTLRIINEFENFGVFYFIFSELIAFTTNIIFI